MRSTRTTLLSGGFNYDPGSWFVTGEIGRVNTRSMLGDQTAAYLSAGYRFGSLTPYATLSRVRANMAVQVPGLDTAWLPPPAAITHTSGTVQGNALVTFTVDGGPVQPAECISYWYDPADCELWAAGRETAGTFLVTATRASGGSGNTSKSP